MSFEFEEKWIITVIFLKSLNMSSSYCVYDSTKIKWVGKINWYLWHWGQIIIWRIPMGRRRPPNGWSSVDHTIKSALHTYFKHKIKGEMSTRFIYFIFWNIPQTHLWVTSVGFSFCKQYRTWYEIWILTKKI